MRKRYLNKKIKRAGAGLALLTAILFSVQGICHTQKVQQNVSICKKENQVKKEKTYNFKSDWNTLMALFDDSLSLIHI